MSSETGDLVDMDVGAMAIESVMIESGVVRRGMLVREFFDLCGRAGVQALPFVDEHESIIGRVTIKNVLRLSCLPDYIVDMAPMLNNAMSCVENAEEKVREILCTPADPYKQGLHQTLPSTAPLIKAVAVMVSNDTSYIFVVDEGVYMGVVTIQGIAARMSQLAFCLLEK